MFYSFKFRGTIIFAISALLALCSCSKEKKDSSLKDLVITDPKSGNLTLVQGDTYNVRYTTVPESAISTAIVEWTVDDPDVAEVHNGRVTAISPGDAVLTAKSGGLTATVNIHVNPVEATSFSLPENVLAFVGKDVLLDVKVEPENANAASLEWESENPDVAEVRIVKGNAVVVGKSEGITTVKATANNLEQTKTMEVAVAENYFHITRYSISRADLCTVVNDGETFDLDDISLSGARVLNVSRGPQGMNFPIDAKKLTITSSNPESVKCEVIFDNDYYVCLCLNEGEKEGASEISVSYSVSESEVQLMRFTVTHALKPFTAETAIYQCGHSEPVASEVKLNRNAIYCVELLPDVSARWTSDNESVAKVSKYDACDGEFRGSSMISTTSEYGEATITATDITGKNSRSFKISVSPSSFPSGTILVTVESEGSGIVIKPVGSGTKYSLRCTYDGQNSKSFYLYNTATRTPITYEQASWKLTSASGEDLSTMLTVNPTYARVTANYKYGYYYVNSAIDATLKVSDDAGNVFSASIELLPPRAYDSKYSSIVVVSDGEIDKDMIDIGHTSTVAVYNSSTKSYENFGKIYLDGISSIASYTSDSDDPEQYDELEQYSVTGKSKGSGEVYAIDEKGTKIKKTISVASFHFAKGSSIYWGTDPYNTTESRWKAGGDFYNTNGWCDYSSSPASVFKVATSGSSVEEYPLSIWSVTSDHYTEQSTYSSDTELDSYYKSIIAASQINYAQSKGMYYIGNYNYKGIRPLFLNVTATDDYGTKLQLGYWTDKYVVLRAKLDFSQQDVKIYYMNSGAKSWSEGDKAKSPSGLQSATQIKEGGAFVKFATGPNEKGLYVNNKYMGFASTAKIWDKEAKTSGRTLDREIVYTEEDGYLIWFNTVTGQNEDIGIRISDDMGTKRSYLVFKKAKD